jgi:hypothetical protein
MRKILPVFVVALSVAAGLALAASKSQGPQPGWHMNASIIEACTCPMFCQCYFNTKPAAHHHGGTEAHFCKFNNAFKVNKGHHGAVKLDGVKFWVSGDLGGDFASGVFDWNVVTFDKAATPQQREAIGVILGHLYPVKWNGSSMAEGDISWTYSKDEPHALLDGGRTAEVHLKRFQGMTAEPVVIKNLKYWGAPRNEGFVMMPNVVQAYRAGDKAYESRGTNGFFITLDIGSADVQKPAGAAGR